MYKIKRKTSNKTKILVIFSAILIIILFSLSLVNRKILGIEDLFKSISTYTYKLINPFKAKNYNQDESYLIQKNINVALESEVAELKKILELNKTFTEYSLINATVLVRNKSYWFNTIEIDKGKKDGIRLDTAVITYDGLVGKVVKVYSNSSEVKLLTSDDVNYKISVSIKSGEDTTYAVLNGYDGERDLLKVTGVSRLSNINKGDIVTTSGLGEVFPAGIYIGEVTLIENDKYDLSKTVYIKSKQNFNDIHYVSVLGGKK